LHQPSAQQFSELAGDYVSGTASSTCDYQLDRFVWVLGCIRGWQRAIHWERSERGYEVRCENHWLPPL
jgi:hypothetical protein